MQTQEILLKIINIYDELKLYNELINYLEKYKLNYDDNKLSIKLGDCYIRNDNIYKAYVVYKENYNKTKDKNRGYHEKTTPNRPFDKRPDRTTRDEHGNTKQQERKLSRTTRIRTRVSRGSEKQ